MSNSRSVKSTVATAFTLCLALLLVPSPGWAQGVVISELQPVNGATLRDEDGDYSDWAELYNTDSVPVDLTGWYLTDDIANRTKWQFPAIELLPKSYLIVFCSGKNRRVPAMPLHTDFRLSGGGEYFGLVQPDGLTVASQFSPEFPAQLRNGSYGFAQEFQETTVLLGDGASGKTLVPQTNLQLEWTAEAFDDSGWAAGSSGFGFEKKRRPTYTELITTDIGNTMHKNNTTVYVRMPFVVADPMAFELLELRMQYDDAFVAYLNGIEIARANANEEPRWNSRATRDRLPHKAATFERFNVTPFRDLLKPGANLLAIHGLNDNILSPDYLLLPELVGYSAADIDLATPLFLAEATPNWPNGTGFPDVSEPPTLSVSTGVYADSVTVAINLPTPAAEGAVIRFTRDGSQPTENSEVYSEPIALNKTTVLKAKTYQPGFLPSAMATGQYVVVDNAVLDFSSNLPIAIVNSFGEVIPPTRCDHSGACDDELDGFLRAHLHLVDVPEAGRTTPGDVANFSGTVGVQKRGSTTINREKATFSVEVWNDDREDRDVELLGFPSESDWILYGALEFDRAHLRDTFMYELGNQIGPYAVRTKFIEMFVNTGDGVVSQDDYFGLYVLMEKIKRGKDRVDIDRLLPSHNTEPEITGGYILKIDRSNPGDQGLVAGGYALNHVYPKERALTSSQKTWLKEYIDRLNNVLKGPDAADPVVGYAQYFDVDQSIDFHILNELGKNPDGFVFSTFLYKPRQGKLTFGPIWDFDHSLGPDIDSRAENPRGWSGQRLGNWFGKLFEDPNFEQKYVDRWFALRENELSIGNIHGIIDSQASEISESQEREFERWDVLGGTTWELEVDQLKEWLANRVEWVDSEFLEEPVISRVRITPELELTITNPMDVGEILYTVNGPDPRLKDGSAAPEALVFDGQQPIIILENSAVQARTRVREGIWSGLTDARYTVIFVPLAITEVMYNPSGGTAFEYIEFFNYGDEAVELTGLSFSAGIDFDFADSAVDSLAPGQYIVIVRDLPSFESIYDTGAMTIAGGFKGALSNKGETLTLVGSVGELILEVAFQDAWYPETDGEGRSLVLIDPESNPDSWVEASAWRPSAQVGGSPGRGESTEPPVGGGQIPGDGNQDGELNLADAIHLLSFLFLGALEPLPCGGGAVDDGANVRLLDSNADSGVDLADAVYNLSYLFLSGEPPALGISCTMIDGCPESCSLSDPNANG